MESSSRGAKRRGDPGRGSALRSRGLLPPGLDPGLPMTIAVRAKCSLLWPAPTGVGPGAAESLFPKAKELRAVIDLGSELAARRGQIVLGDDRERRAFAVRLDEGLLVQDANGLVVLGPAHIEIVEGGVRNLNLALAYELDVLG